MNTKRKTTRVTSLNVRIDDELKERIAAIAAYRDITMSQLAREWFNDCVELEEKVINQVKKELGEI